MFAIQARNKVNKQKDKSANKQKKQYLKLITNSVLYK